MTIMKQWVVGLTALGLLCAVSSIGAYGAEDKEKKDKVSKDKDKGEEGPKPKVEKDGAPVKPGVIPPGTPMCYKYVTQYRAEKRTVCEWVRVTADVEVEEVHWVPHKRK